MKDTSRAERVGYVIGLIGVVVFWVYVGAGLWHNLADSPAQQVQVYEESHDHPSTD